MGSSLLPKMKLTLLLFLIPLALAQPQNFRENIRNIVRNNPQVLPNCGEGGRPDFCTCRDGSTFTLPPTSIPPCGGRRQMESCTCANGNTISSSQIRNAIIPLLQG